MTMLLSFTTTFSRLYLASHLYLSVIIDACRSISVVASENLDSSFQPSNQKLDLRMCKSERFRPIFRLPRSTGRTNDAFRTDCIVSRNCFTSSRNIFFRCHFIVPSHTKLVPSGTSFYVPLFPAWWKACFN